MAISSADVTAVLEKVDILALIQEHVPLRRVGTRHVGLCPFHSEGTPSFSVNPQMGVYYCFGCHASGDAITFVRNVDRMDFADAVEYLANRVGITIVRDSVDETKKRGQLKKVRETLERALDFFQKNLHDDIGKHALAYLDSRGISDALISQFRIGVSPIDPFKLGGFLKVENELFAAAGLGYVDSHGRARDMFAGRLVFPIFDQSGNPLAFGGRVIPGADYPGEAEPAKYKNSPETENYAKRRTLYGLNWAKSEIVRQDRAIICEGYTDVIAFFGADVPLAVATCGTALTEDHLDRLKNFSKNIVLAFDGDKAGANATERIYEWERKFSLNVRVANFPEGEDPASLALSDPKLLALCIEQARPFLSFRLERLIKSLDLSTIEGRVAAGDAALELVAEHPNALVRGEYVMMVADYCKLDPKQLARRIDGFVKVRQNRPRQTRQSDEYPNKMASSHEQGERGVITIGPDVGNSVGGESNRPSAIAINELFDASLRPYNEAIRQLLQRPSELADFMPEYLFAHPVHLELVRHILAKRMENDIVSSSEQLSPTARALLMRLIVVPSEMDEVDVIGRLVEMYAGRLVDEMVRNIRNQSQEAGHDHDQVRFFSETVTYIRGVRARLRDHETRDGAVTELLDFFARTRV